ncbi:hypothetical protein [Helicobacter sp. 23-1045]
MNLAQILRIQNLINKMAKISQNLNVDCHENATHFLAMTAWGRFALRFGLPRFAFGKSRNDGNRARFCE